MTPFLTKQELEKKRKAKGAVLPKIKREAGETDPPLIKRQASETDKAFMDRLLNDTPDPKTTEVPKQKSAQQSKRNAAWKSMNESTATVKASGKATKYRLPADEELEASRKQQKQKKELSSKAEVKTEVEQKQDSPREVTVEGWVPAEEETLYKEPAGQMYNMTADGKLIEEPTEKPFKQKLAESKAPGFKHFITDIIDSNEIYQMKDDILGLEYGESISEKENLDTYEELLSNPDIVSKLRDRAVSNFNQLHPNKEVDDYTVDMMVNDAVKTRIAQEKKDKLIEDNLFIKQERAKNNYVPTLNAGARLHMDEIDPEERAIASNVKLARSLQKVMDDANASEASKTKAALDLEKLGGTLESQLKKYDSDYSYMFDNQTGRRLSKAEVENRIAIDEEGTMTDREAEVKEMKALHKDQDLESLERGYFTHITRHNNFNKNQNKTYDINPSNSYIRETLYKQGYRFKPGTTTFQGVKAKDLTRFIGQNSFAKDIENGISIASEKGKGPQVTGLVVPFLKDLAKEKTKLEVEREAYKTSYLMNIDPKSLKQTLLGTVGRFAEAASEATIGEKATREFFGSTDRKQLDEIKRVFEEYDIKPSKEQMEAFERSRSMKVVEGVGAFIPELFKFAAVNAATGGILGVTGYAARIAALGRSKNIFDKTLFLGFNALKEEITFKTATLGESHTGGGAGFYLGGQAMNAIVPFNFTGAFARFNPFIRKVALAGPGMAVGSEAAALTEAAYKEMRGKKDFRTSMEEMYGDNSETWDRMVVNAWVGGLIGTHHVKRMDLKSMSQKRALFDKTTDEIVELELAKTASDKTLKTYKDTKTLYINRDPKRGPVDPIPKNLPDGYKYKIVQNSEQLNKWKEQTAEKVSVKDIDKKIEQKKNVLALLGREIEIADRNFINQDIGTLKKQMNEAQSKIDKHNDPESKEGKLTDKELLEAENLVAKGQAQIVAVRRSIERNFKAVTAKGDFLNGVKLEIIDGSKDSNGVERVGADENAKFFPDNNTIYLDINKNKKGILGHELGHAIMKAAFNNDPVIAEKFKETIKNQVETALAGRRFAGNKTFEEAINEAYKDKPKMLAEEYIMNVVDFIQKPANRDVLLSTDLLPTLKRSIGELGVKLGIDLTSNKPMELGEKNMNRASDVLEALYDLGNVAGGKSATALKNKFEKFKNVTIDGKRLIDLNTGSEITTENKAINDIESMASKNISENEKKDIFSKATRAYEEVIESGGSPEVAGLMVGMEMAPLVKKQVEGYLAAKGITMSRDRIQDIVDSLTTDSGTATVGIPNMTEAWAKGQGLVEYIKTENPSREAINSKAKELRIQDRTSAGSDSSTIDKYIKMAKGETEQAQLTSYIFGNLPKRILQTLQKSEFADTFNTFSMEDVKNIDKLEEGVGISGASSSGTEGYVDTSSPEQYTRVSQKKAEITLELPAEFVEKVNKDANMFLNSQKLENLDAKAIGTVPLKDGGKAKVAMLESDKARIIYPDGKVETIKARSPKLVEQHLGAPNKSFEKQFNFKERLAEDFKNSLFNDLSEHAGNIIDNKKATPKYEKFIDNAFPLFKTFIGQSSVNKRFAAFKEPYIDPATGKQAREKTAAGNPIFTKKNVTLAEWRKYFLGDGSQRIDGKRRSIIEALATELGFDATMNVLGKEAMRKQLESRQGDLSVDLADNYVAVIAKQIDRNSPNSMASKIIEEVAKQFKLSKEEATSRLRSIVYDNEDKIKPTEIIIKDPIGKIFYEECVRFAEKDYREAFDTIIASEKVNTDTRQKLIEKGIDPKEINLNEFVDIENLSSERITEYHDFVNGFLKGWPIKTKQLTLANSARVANSVLSQIFGHTGRPSKKTKYNFSRENFEKVTENAEFDGKYSGITKKTRNKFEKWIKDLEKYNTKGKGITIKKNLSEYLMKADATSRLPGLDAKTKKEIIMNEIEGREEAIADLNLKSRFLDIILNVAGEKIAKLTKPKDREKFARNFAVMLLNNDGLGMRSLSSERWQDISNSDILGNPKNEHLMAKAEFAAEVLKNLLDGTLSESKVEELVDSYQSLMGNKQGQLLGDALLGRTPRDAFFLKLGIPQLMNVGIEANPKELLENVIDWTTGKDAWETLVENKMESELSNSMASKNIAEDLSKMIERKKGIPAGKEMSASKASIIGRDKGKFKFFVPPNAEDFAGLLYKFYGKGKQGDADMKLMKETLLDPYEKAENALSSYRQKLANDLKAMDKKLNEIGGKVTKESKEALKKTGFDSDQATRVYIWNKKGEKIPDITADEVTELSNIVSNDARLRAYADGVMGLVDFPAPTDSWYASNLKYDLYKYSTEGVRKDFLAPWKKNMDAMFTPENYNRMEAAYGKDFVDNFKQLTKRMETGKARPENIGKIASAGLDWINGSVGVIMWMNTRSAVLQTISAVNYINWKDNNLFAAGKTLTKPVEFARTFKELMNSDFLKQRRSGLEINIEDAEIAKAIEKGGNAPERLFGKLIKAGFKPTQIADSFAIAVGGTPFYINRTKTYQKEVIINKDGDPVRKYTDAEAKQKAFDDFRALSEEHQQSSRQDRVSNVQLGALGRLVFAFNNTPMQMTRLQKKAASDIINGRGDAKTNVSKLVYYGLVQSAIFYALQQGAFGMLFGKDEDELKEGEAEYLAKKKEDKAVKLANGMIDSFLSGAGMTGKMIVTAKNTLLKYQSESKKGYNASTAAVINEALSISPPLSSKTKKIASALKEIKYSNTKKGKKEAEGKGVLNSPNTMAGSKLIAAGTNIPIDRFLNKINNVATVVSDENVEDWQRIALALGWDKYSLGLYEDPYLDPTEQAAADALAKKEASEAAKITRDAKKAEEKAAYDALPQVTKDSLEFVEIKEKEKKSRDKYIKEQVRKSKLTPEQLEYEKYLAKEKRKLSNEKAKATKIRNQKIKDSINFSNTRR